MRIIYHERCLEYSSPGHPESPERIRQSLPLLQKHYTFLKPEPATESQILKAHSAEHLERVKQQIFYEPDCPAYDNIFEIAALAAGAAILASQVNGFSLMRPPGHHANRDRLAGFCYFNNLAVAVKNLNKTTLIVDFDGHHGDGTEAIFLGDPNVKFISLHSSPNYPGTGLFSQQNCINVPLPHDCGDKIYLNALERAIKQVDMTNIEQVAVSAGFDAFERDPLASLGLSSICYKSIGEMIAALHKPTFAVLEGGYDIEHLGNNIHNFIQGLQAGNGT